MRLTASGIGAGEELDDEFVDLELEKHLARKALLARRSERLQGSQVVQSSFQSSRDFNSSGPLVTVTATPSIAPSPAPLLFGQAPPHEPSCSKRCFGIGPFDGNIPASRLIHPNSPFHYFWTGGLFRSTILRNCAQGAYCFCMCIHHTFFRMRWLIGTHH